VEENGRQEVYVAMSPICESLGVDSKSQRRKVQSNPSLPVKFSRVL
jgi:hypothetical protein